MIEVFNVLKIFSVVFAVGCLINGILFHLAMYKPRDYRYSEYMTNTFVGICLGMAGWFFTNLAQATYIEMAVRTL